MTILLYISIQCRLSVLDFLSQIHTLQKYIRLYHIKVNSLMPFCCMMHMHLGSCLLTPFLKIYQSNISNIFSLFLTFLQGLTLLHHLQLHLASAFFQMVRDEG